MDDGGPDKLDQALGLAIRLRRHARGLSQSALGEAIGVSFQQIQKYERGANRVSFSRLLEIAHALDCGLANLAQGLDVDAQPDVRGINDLLAVEGAMDLLSAYSGIESRELRRALLQHARALGACAGRPCEPSG